MAQSELQNGATSIANIVTIATLVVRRRLSKETCFIFFFPEFSKLRPAASGVNVDALPVSIAMSAGVFFDYHFTGEGPVDKGEVSRRQDHAEGPPQQANF